MDKKEIKDVIMFLENCIHHGEEDSLQAYEVKYNHWMKKIIILLERGEKYEQIVDEIDRFLEPGMIFEIPEGCTSSGHIDIIRYTIDKIRQKYFPKLIKKTFTIELEEGKKGVMNRVIKDFKNGKLGNWCEEAIKVNMFKEGD